MNGEHAEAELLDGYALGTLTKADAERVRQHVALCERCRAELGELRSVADVLPFTLEQAVAPAHLRDRILERIDEPAPQTRSIISPLTAGLAAALALAVGGDIWLATLVRGQTSPAVAVVTTPSAVPTRAPVVDHPTSAPHARVPEPTPAATARPSVDRAAMIALRSRVAQLEAALADVRRSASLRDTSDAARIVGLQSELAAARREIVATAVVPRSTPSPEPGPSAPTDADLVAALSTGHVYSVDGAIGTQAWHLTIVQPLAGKNALIYTRTPDAPSGDTYRTWVVRGGQTYDAGALPPDSVTKLEMPMPLESGDIVAFSREPLGTGSLPTTPFLMQVTIRT
jgi:anti-sigma factor ChrR (cupin superfamily)